MTIRKQLFWATTALVSSLFIAESAAAQSTASQAADERATQVGDVVVTDLETDRNRTDQQRVAEWNQFPGAFGSLNSGNFSNGQHIALF